MLGDRSLTQKSTLWFHLYEVLEQAKLIYGEEKIKTVVCVVVCVWKWKLIECGHEGVLISSEDLGHTGTFIFEWYT